MRRLILGAVLVATVVGAAAVPRLGSAQTTTPPWSTFHGDQKRDGGLNVNGTGQVSFINEYDLPPGIKSSPAVDAKGVAYIGDSDGNIYALSPDASHHTALWTRQTGSAVESSPSLSPDGKTLYVGTNGGKVMAISTADGSVIWSVQFVGQFKASPLVSLDGNTIFIPNSYGTIYALKTSDGSTVWTNTPAGPIPGSLAMSDDGSTLYVATSTNMYAIATNNSGETIFYTDGPATGTPSVDANGNIYVMTGTGYLDSFSPGSSAPRWKQPLFNLVPSATTPAFYNGLAIFGASNGYVYAWKQSDGTQQWQYHAAGPVSASPAVATGNGRIYTGSSDGTIYVLDANGQLLNKRSVGGAIDASPAISADGSVWFASESGSVYRIADILPPATIPAPTNPPATSTPVATDTPTATSTPTATATPTATSTPTPIQLDFTLVDQVKDGQRQKIVFTSAPNTDIHVRVNYPNGDHQSHLVHTNGQGTKTYSYRQGSSKTTHNDFTATVIATAGSGSTLNTVQKTYQIQFGAIDASAEPRTQAIGKTVDVFVHASKNTHVVLYILAPSGKAYTLYGKTGKRGFASFKFKLPKGLAKSGQKVKLVAKLAANNTSTSTTFTVK